MALKKRMYYCNKCKKASIKSYFETRRCLYCGNDTKEIYVNYSVYTIAAWIILIIGMFPFLIYPDMIVLQKLLILAIIVIVVFSFGLVGVEKMKRDATRIGQKK